MTSAYWRPKEMKGCCGAASQRSKHASPTLSTGSTCRPNSSRFGGPARRATSARTCSPMSLATGEDLASFRLGHSQDVLKLHKMVQLRRLLLRQAFFLLSLDQFSDSALRFGRGQEMSDRFRGCARGDEVDNLEIGGADRTHLS